MNDINIYARYDYRKLRKKASFFFDNKYRVFNPKSVFAPLKGTYLISINRFNIHVAYWDENSKEGIEDKKRIKNFLEENIFDMNIVLEYSKKCDIVSILEENNILI